VSIAHLVNHRVVLYRETAVRDQYGDTVQSWAAQTVPAGLNAFADLGWSGVLQDSGPGEQQANKRRWFLTFDARERDVLEVVGGVEAPMLLRIVSVMRAARPTKATAHHVEVNVEVWHGATTLQAVEPEEPEDPEPEEPEE
jgi:hypothetical protein